MKYYLNKYGEGNDHLGLFEKRGDKHELLAEKGHGVWRWCDNSSSRQFYAAVALHETTDITKEEAAMILFSARSPA